MREAIEDWVAEESIDVAREDEKIAADEDELIENISLIVAIALDELSE